MTDSNAQILEQLKKHESYLQQISLTQQELLEVNKQRLVAERSQMIIGWLKIIILVAVAWISFVAAKNMIQGLTKNMGGLLSNSSLDAGPAREMTDQLQNSQELLRELLGA